MTATDRKEGQKYGFDWGKYLTDQKGEAAPVQLFGHAQMSSNWVEIEVGVKVEVLNSDCPVSSKVYWIAQIMKVAGYKVLLRYEGFGDDSSCDFWCNLCTDDVHAVGWCATVGKPLVPPRTIQFKYSNWKSFLIEQLTGSKTLPNDFDQRVTQSMECAFKPKMRVEVMDKTQISRKRIGIIEEIVGGRLRLQYEDSDEPNDDFWCHCSSSLIHPIGWSERVGHRILVANKDYKFALGFKNSKPDMFVPVKLVKSCGFKVGMKLEAIDPLNLSSICVATIRKVLKSGYLMIGIDGSEAAGGTDWFCYHCSSPSIFPVGYCSLHNITLSIPNNYKPAFSWPEYLKQTKSEAAPANLFLKEDIDHGFTRGMKLESVDLMDPRMICVASVSRVVGRLLRVHFDGWDAEYDQWVDSQSPDIFPVGWCELFNYDIQPPPNYRNKIETSNENKRKAKNRTTGFSGKKKKKKLTTTEKKDPANTVETNKISAETSQKNETATGLDDELDLSESNQSSLQDVTVDNSDFGPPQEEEEFPMEEAAEISVDDSQDNHPKRADDLNPPNISDDLDVVMLSDDSFTKDVDENPPNCNKSPKHGDEEEIQEDSELDVSQDLDLELPVDSEDLIERSDSFNQSDIENIPPAEMNSNDLGSSQETVDPDSGESAANTAGDNVDSGETLPSDPNRPELQDETSLSDETNPVATSEATAVDKNTES